MIKSLLLTVFVLLALGKLAAQNTPNSDSIKHINEIVVTYQADKRTPVTFQNIYSKTIKEKSTGQEPSFLLSETPSIVNYSDAGSSQGYSYFRIRGIDQTRINMTIDGVPLNEPEDQGVYFANYPDVFNFVSKIQIQRGIGTTKNGVASFGGSVQLFSPSLLDTNKVTFGLGFGSFNSFRAFGEYNSGIKDNKALYIRASQIYSDGYKYHSSNNSQSVFMSAGLFFDKSIWKLNILAGNQQNGLSWIGVTDSLTKIDRRTNANNEQEKDKFFQTLTQVLNFWQINQLSSLESSIYFTFLKGNYDFDFNNFIGKSIAGELYNYAFLSNFLGFFSNYTFSNDSFNLKIGLHGSTYSRQHTGSEKTIGKLYQNTGHKNEISAFSKADYDFKILTCFAELQYRYVNFDYNGSVSLQRLEWYFLNPKLGISGEINPNSTLYYAAGYSGREPTRNDMFGGNDNLLVDSLGKAILYNTKPEHVINHELGIRFQKEEINFNVNLYYMDFKNEITLDGKFGPNGLALTNNVEQSFRTGLELSLTYNLTKYISISNNSSFNYSRIKSQKETFSPILTPPIVVNQELIYNKNNITIAILARYQHNAYIDFANTQIVKNYLLLNSRASYSFNGITFSIFLNNITNSKYSNHGYVDFDNRSKYFVQAPTNISASLQYSY